MQTPSGERAPFITVNGKGNLGEDMEGVTNVTYWPNGYLEGLEEQDIGLFWYNGECWDVGR